YSTAGRCRSGERRSVPFGKDPVSVESQHLAVGLGGGQFKRAATMDPGNGLSIAATIVPDCDDVGSSPSDWPVLDIGKDLMSVMDLSVERDLPDDATPDQFGSEQALSSNWHVAKRADNFRHWEHCPLW
ncbi:hypothetical protein, partial [Klebsiella aerogenes]|uniref:hypothetical protein n=1 Tax=Klebsiella aerogenes TaxID=548 RepID=UPI0019532DF7